MILKTSEKRMKEIQNTMAGHSSRLEQAEERISQLEDEMVIKRKTEELLVRQLKSCERNMKELTDCIKKPRLRLMGIEEGEEVQAKRISNILNKIITENFPNLEKTMPIQDRKPPRHQIGLTKIELPHDKLSLKQQAQRIENEY
jgi:chromosome segregation ATPase